MLTLDPRLSLLLAPPICLFCLLLCLGFGRLGWLSIGGRCRRRGELTGGKLECSPDDVFLLTSAVDNEIKQYLTVDGRLHMNLDVPKTGLEENYTRSYYTSSGRWVWISAWVCVWATSPIPC